MKPDLVYVGIRGHVLGLNRSDGNILWERKLKGSDFVTLTWDREEVLAVTAGEVFCLNATHGTILWHNRLPGWGTGFASILVPGGMSTSEVLAAAARHREQENAHNSVTPGA